MCLTGSSFIALLPTRWGKREETRLPGAFICLDCPLLRRRTVKPIREVHFDNSSAPPSSARSQP